MILTKNWYSTPIKDILLRSKIWVRKKSRVANKWENMCGNIRWREREINERRVEKGEQH